MKPGNGLAIIFESRFQPFPNMFLAIIPFLSLAMEHRNDS
jgi:hypothetical protein